MFMESSILAILVKIVASTYCFQRGYIPQRFWCRDRQILRPGEGMGWHPRRWDGRTVCLSQPVE
jgi:hypothetical protein